MVGTGDAAEFDPQLAVELMTTTGRFLDASNKEEETIKIRRTNFPSYVPRCESHSSPRYPPSVFTKAVEGSLRRRGGPIAVQGALRDRRLILPH